jgi:hypothetical protein
VPEKLIFTEHDLVQFFGNRLYKRRDKWIILYHRFAGVDNGGMVFIAGLFTYIR